MSPRASPAKTSLFRPLVFVALASACAVSGVVGSLYLSSANLSPASGGAVTVTPAQSAALAGASLSLPPGALASPALIGVEEGVADPGGDWIASGPSVAWEPADLRLLAPAGFTLPAKLPDGVDPGDLTVLTNGAGGAERIFGAGVQLDPQAGLVHFSAQHLGNFQAVFGKPCTGRTGCLPGDSCERGQCIPDDGNDAGPP